MFVASRLNLAGAEAARTVRGLRVPFTPPPLGRRVVPLLLPFLFALFTLTASNHTAQAQPAGPTPQDVPADWSLIPAGLGTGAQFRLLFLTDAATTATSSDISSYNAFVQGADVLNGATVDPTIRALRGEFRALASTAAVDARDNTATTGTGVAIYWLNGAKVADDYGDFYDGSWDSREARNEAGSTEFAVGYNPEAWTGSDNDGTEYFDGTTSRALGAAGGSAQYGDVDVAALNRLDSALTTESRSIYAISPVFTVVNQGAPAGQTVPGDWPLIPSDASDAGDQFRLLFLTSGARAAASANIGDYNFFVQAHAGGGHEAIRPYRAEFRALASTAAVDAIDNTATTFTMTDKGVPVYALSVDASGDFNGAQVADDYEALYQGSWSNTANKDESGAAHAATRVWTGTDEATGQEAGTSGLGTDNPRTGVPSDADQALDRGGDNAQDSTYPLYGLSPVFTVSSVPSPPAAPVVENVTDVSARALWGEPSFTGAHPIFQYGIRVRRCLIALTASCTVWTGWGDVAAVGGGGHIHVLVVTTYRDDQGTEDAADDEDLNLQPETRYQVQVEARSRENALSDPVYSGWSGSTTFVTAPARPTDLRARPGDTQVELSWQSTAANPAQLSHYTVEYDEDADFSSPQRLNTAASDPGANTLAPTALTVTGLTSGTEYHFRVRAARGTAAASRWSEATAATPSAPPTDDDDDSGGGDSGTTLPADDDGGGGGSGTTKSSGGGGGGGSRAPSPPPVPTRSPLIGSTPAATAVELAGDLLVLRRHDEPGVEIEVGIGWISRDGQRIIVIGFVRDGDLGQTYAVVRREGDGRVVRRWIAPDSDLVYAVPWPIVNTQYTFPVGVILAIPLDDQYPWPNMLTRRFDGGDDRILAYDAELGQWRHVPDPGTFQARGYYWCNVTAADAGFFDRVTLGPPYPASGVLPRADYPVCQP